MCMFLNNFKDIKRMLEVQEYTKVLEKDNCE